MGKQGVNANLLPRGVEIQFGGAILLGDRVVALSGHCSPEVAASRNAITNRAVVSNVHGSQQQDEHQQGAFEDGESAFHE